LRLNVKGGEKEKDRDTLRKTDHKKKLWRIVRKKKRKDKRDFRGKTSFQESILRRAA